MAVALPNHNRFPKFFDRCKTVSTRLPFNRRPSTREQNITEALFNPPLSPTLGTPLNLCHHHLTESRCVRHIM